MAEAKGNIKRKSRKDMQLLSRSILQQEGSSTRIVKIIIIFLVLITAFFFFWSTNVPLNEVVISQGFIKPLEDVYLMQHAAGGEITEMLVSERENVVKGQPLLRLDGSMLEQRVKEANSELYSLRMQRDLLLEELEIQKKLHEQRLISTVEYLSLQREIIEIRGRITATSQLMQRYQMQDEDLVLYAPISGSVHGLGSHGPGTIIRAGETIFSIIPQDAKFYAQINIPASQIGSIKPGLPVILKFSAYNFSKYGGIQTTVKEFSATTFIDSSGEPYYEGIVVMPKTYIGENPTELPILQGMTLTAEIMTGTKTLFEYLFLPVKASKNSAFSEP